MLLAARLRPDRPAACRAQDLGGQHFGGQFVGAQDVYGAGDDLRVDDLAVLEQQAELFDQAANDRSFVSLDVELVAPGDDPGATECLLHGTQVLVEWADQPRHQVVWDCNCYWHVYFTRVAVNKGRQAALPRPS